jgi:hypothetical protein
VLQLGPGLTAIILRLGGAGGGLKARLSPFKRVDRSLQTDVQAEPARPEVGTASGASARLSPFYGPVYGSRMWLKSQGFWTIPEQLFESVAPGQPPLSRWIAHIESVLMPFALAKS